MIQSNAIYSAYQITAGQFVTLRAGFVSTEMLTKTILRFNPGFYTDIGEPVGVAFQKRYEPAPGRYKMDKINCKNYEAYLKIIDAYNFEIEYSFFATRNLGGWIPDVAHVNSTSLDVAPLTGAIGFYISAGQETASVSIPIQLSAFTESDVVFNYYRPNTTQASGYTPGENLYVHIKTFGTVGNNYYAGIIKEDAISNTTDIVPGLIHNYGKVSAGVQQVSDLPKNCYHDSAGFVQFDENSVSEIILDGACLKSGSAYRVYIVYYQDGIWKSSISDPIFQQALKAPVVPNVTYSFTDAFGNATAKSCVKGLSRHISSDLCVTVDTGDYNTKLTAAGLTGSWSSRLKSVRVYNGFSSSSQSGGSIAFTENGDTVCVADYLPQKNKISFVVFQFILQMDGYKDIIQAAFELHYDAPEVPAAVAVYDADGLVEELCDGEEYMISEDFSECTTYMSVDGSDYVQTDVFSGLDLDVSILPKDSKVCIQAVCDQGFDEDDEPECDDCPPCGASKTLTIYTDINGAPQGYISVAVSGGDPGTFELFGETGTIGGSPISVPLNAAAYVFRFVVESEKGCKYIGNALFYQIDNFSIAGEQVTIQAISANEDCECEEVTICDNKASFNFECDEENHVITVDVVKIFHSPVESEDFLCSMDGGLTLIPCPSSFTGEKAVYVTYKASFSDGCHPIHIEQVIECSKYEEYGNSRDIDLSIEENTLVIEIDSEFNSTPIYDRLFVSKDGGKTFQEYDILDTGGVGSLALNESKVIDGMPDPIPVNDGDAVVVYTLTQFEDGFSDLVISEKILVKIEDIGEDCTLSYDEYMLEVTYDDEDGIFTVTPSGNESALEINELLWTMGGANPFDENKSGIPYSDPVTGEGLFIARWKIKLPDCNVKIIDGVAWGKKCIQICNLDDIPMPQTTLISCCDGCPGYSLSIVCVNRVMSISGVPQDATVTWEGPGGFTGTGLSVTFPAETPSGYFTAAFSVGNCDYNAMYNYTKPEAGTPVEPIIII